MQFHSLKVFSFFALLVISSASFAAVICPAVESIAGPASLELDVTTSTEQSAVSFMRAAQRAKFEVLLEVNTRPGVSSSWTVKARTTSPNHAELARQVQALSKRVPPESTHVSCGVGKAAS